MKTSTAEIVSLSTRVALTLPINKTKTTLALIFLAFLVFGAQASPGDLDLTFGVDGTLQIDSGNNLIDSAQSVAIQSDGKIVSVGYTTTANNDKNFAVFRTNPDGTLDNNFNGSGKLNFTFNSGNRDDVAKAVAVQPDGKIVVAGYADVSGFGNFDIVLARLNTDGSFDSSFGTGGKVITNLNDRADYGNGVTLQTDGRIVVAGYSNRTTTGDDFVVIRYNANGTLDTGFNGTGIVMTDILTNRSDRANGLAIQTDGKIVAAGYTNDPSFGNNFAVVRYNTNGSLDTNFNGTGKANTDLNLNSSDFGNAVTVQSNGQIIVAGESSSDFGLTRYNSNGTLDVTFGGGDGIVTTNFGTNAADTGRAVAVRTDGKIIIAGKSRTELAFAQYNTDGTLDNTFDSDGLLIQNAGNNQLSAFGGYYGIALQNDGKIVAVGDGWRDFSLNDFSVSRINANGTFDFTFNGGDGIASTDIFGAFDETANIALQSDGKIVAAGRTQDSSGANRFAVVRYNVNGTPDTSFDNDGIVTTDIQQYDLENAQALAVQTDGKILVAGSARNPSTLVDAGFLIRYNANGSLDSSFGLNGISITVGNTVGTDANTWLYPYDIALQPDGKIVVAGLADYISVYGDGYVARYNTNGTPDTSFLTNITNSNHPNGSVVVNFGFNYNVLNAVTLQNDGRIVVTGWTNESSPDLTVARLNANGSLDTSFDGDGKLTTDFGNNTSDIGNDVIVQPDGKILAVGRTDINFIDMAAARYNVNGSLDATFGGGDGKLNINFNGWADVASGVALQSDGKIILGGYADLERNFGGFALVKLTSNGSFDTGFNNGTGRLITNLGEGVNTGLQYAVNDVILQPDGKILLGGACNFNSTGKDFTIIRYQNPQGGSVQGLHIFDFDGDGKSDLSVFRPSNAVWYLNRSTAGFISFPFGISTDKIVPADYDGDNKTDVAVFRDGAWYILRSSDSTFAAVRFGDAGDVPVPADYDGDNKADIAIFRGGIWYVSRSTAGYTSVAFGIASDKPIPGDYDGDGKTDIAVFRNGAWYVLRSSDGTFSSLLFGNSGDAPVPADYDGDGKVDQAVRRGDVWYLNRSTAGFSAFAFGVSTDTQAVADYDGDGKADPAVFRSGIWYSLRSTTGFSAVAFGDTGDQPIESVYLR